MSPRDLSLVDAQGELDHEAQADDSAIDADLQRDGDLVWFCPEGDRLAVWFPLSAIAAAMAERRPISGDASDGSRRSPGYGPGRLFTERVDANTFRVDGRSLTVVEWPRNITECAQGRARRDNRATFGEALIRRP